MKKKHINLKRIKYADDSVHGDYEHIIDTPELEDIISKELKISATLQLHNKIRVSSTQDGKIKIELVGTYGI